MLRLAPSPLQGGEGKGEERNSTMTHAEKIMRAVATLVYTEDKGIFTRDEIRIRIGVDRDEWMAGYTSIFQGMRSDQPGGAPPVGKRFCGVFQVRRGKYSLRDYGWDLLEEFKS
jgi:hypothetical protein